MEQGSGVRRSWRRSLLAAAILIGACGHASAFPNSREPIRIIVPAPAGGALDVVSRVFANEATKSLNHPVIVENRPGGHSAIAAGAVSRAAPDGHTLLATSTSLAMTQAIYGERVFDLVKQFSPVSMIASGPLLMVVNKDLPIRTVADVVSLAKERPNGIRYGTGGVGTSMHLTAVLFQNSFGIEMLHVPFQGGGPALNALLGGHIDLLFDPVVTLLPQATSGTVRPIAITSASRSPFLPEVPTVRESGAPEFDVAGWFGLLAPADTPPDVLAVLQGEVVKALAVADVKARLAGLGVEAVGSTPAGFAVYLRGEVDRWTRVVRASNIKPD